MDASKPEPKPASGHHLILIIGMKPKEDQHDGRATGKTKSVKDGRLKDKGRESRR